jgi:hypothetical protein
MKNRKIKTILIGMGKMGFTSDFYSKEKIQTHYKALSNNKHIELVGVLEKKNKFKLKQKVKNIKIFNSYNDIKYLNFELAVVAVPTKQHYKTLKFLCKLEQVKAIICEKPFTDKYEKAKEIFSLSKKKKIKLYTNYLRRAIPSFHKLKNFIKKKTSNKSFQINIYYSKSLMRNGCHFIDLVQYLFGKIHYAKYDKIANTTLLKISKNTVILNLLKNKMNINFLEISFDDKKIIIDKETNFFEKDLISNNLIPLNKFKRSREEMNIYQKLNLDLFLKNYLYNQKKDTISLEKNVLSTLRVIKKSNYK